MEFESIPNSDSEWICWSVNFLAWPLGKHWKWHVARDSALSSVVCQLADATEPTNASEKQVHFCGIRSNFIRSISPILPHMSRSICKLINRTLIMDEYQKPVRNQVKEAKDYSAISHNRYTMVIDGLHLARTCNWSIPKN